MYWLLLSVVSLKSKLKNLEKRFRSPCSCATSCYLALKHRVKRRERESASFLLYLKLKQTSAPPDRGVVAGTCTCTWGPL